MLQCDGSTLVWRTPLRFSVPASLFDKLVVEARRASKDPQTLLVEIVATSLAHVVVPQVVVASSRCLCPTCPNGVLCLGLCPRHYPRARWFAKKGQLNVGWLVRNGRMLPARGRTLADHALPPGARETLETLPSIPPDLMPDTLWLFGHPQAQAERERLSS